jgi:hypothetical protein
MPHPLYVPILIAGMLITGRQVFSTYYLQLATNPLPAQTRYGQNSKVCLVQTSHKHTNIQTHITDMQCVERCDDPNPAKRVTYEQPVWQSLNMFIGELGCTYGSYPSIHPSIHPAPAPAPAPARSDNRTPYCPSDYPASASQVSSPCSTPSRSPDGQSHARGSTLLAAAMRQTKNVSYLRMQPPAPNRVVNPFAVPTSYLCGCLHSATYREQPYVSHLHTFHNLPYILHLCCLASSFPSLPFFPSSLPPYHLRSIRTELAELYLSSIPPLPKQTKIKLTNG